MYVYAYLCSICVRAEHACAMECLLSEDNTGCQSLPFTVVKAGFFCAPLLLGNLLPLPPTLLCENWGYRFMLLPPALYEFW